MSKKTFKSLLSENKKKDTIVLNGERLQMSEKLKMILYSDYEIHPKIKGGITRGFVINMICKSSNLSKLLWTDLTKTEIEQTFIDSNGNEFEISGLEPYFFVFLKGISFDGYVFLSPT